jgi:hypothetical protein
MYALNLSFFRQFCHPMQSVARGGRTAGPALATSLLTIILLKAQAFELPLFPLPFPF